VQDHDCCPDDYSSVLQAIARMTIPLAENPKQCEGSAPASLAYPVN
jgi:hypothetical protein